MRGPGGLLLFIILAAAGRVWAADLPADVPAGPFPPAECISCHAVESPDLVTAWRTGPHGDAATPRGCVACHGQRHAGATARARRGSVCRDCHGGREGPVVRSHATSKHGVIETLESPRWDWSAPLASANYRAPGCAYCHLHEGAHGARGGETPAFACLDCHSPRFAETVLETAARSLEIGRLKTREADQAIETLGGSSQDLDALRTRMQASLAALRAGLYHASPDYQWWYGQAALDGDLVRIKAALTRCLRQPASSPDDAPATGVRKCGNAR